MMEVMHTMQNWLFWIICGLIEERNKKNDFLILLAMMQTNTL